MSDANRLPDSALPDMLINEGYYKECGSIFSDRLLASRLGGIKPMSHDQLKNRWPNIPQALDSTRVRLLTAMAGIQSWGYCHRKRKNETSTAEIHATFIPKQKRIVLYSTSCDPLSLYQDRLKSYDFGHRFFLVSAHELGHALDATVGDLPATSTLTAELRATWYGTFFAQCFSRLWQNILRDAVETDDHQKNRRVKHCWLHRWQKHELEIARLRKDIAIRLSTPKHVGSPLESPQQATLEDYAGEFACASDRYAGRR